MSNLDRWRRALVGLLVLVVSWCLPGCGSKLEQSSDAAPLPAVTASVAASDTDSHWSAWLGGPKFGVAPDETLPLKWSSSEGFRWKVAVPGEGNSSPVVWGDYVLVTSAVGPGNRPMLKVLCFDRRDGRLVWDADAGPSKGGTHVKNGHASASVATDGERIVASFGSAGLFCYDYQGHRLWEAPLGDLEHVWGTASSPTIYGDRVFQLCDRTENSSLAAFDLKTGEELWRTPRDSYGSWSTPILVEAESADGGAPRTELIVNGTGTDDSGGGWTIAYDPATGAELWRVQGTTDIVCPTTMVGGGYVYSTSGRNGPTIAIRPGGSGDVTDSEVVWKLRRGGAYVPTGVFYGNRLFSVSDGGVATCLNAGNGEQIWRERLGGAFTASVVAGAGRIYAINERGSVYVMAADDKYQLLATNEMNERCLATPAISDGEIFLRTEGHLYCIPTPAKPAATAADDALPSGELTETVADFSAETDSDEAATEQAEAGDAVPRIGE